MDLSTLQEKLGDEMFTELETYVNDLTGQRDQARNESISGRKGLKSELQTLKTQQADLLEKLGVDSIDAIDDLPDAKGAADAAAQFEARLKRKERELTEALAAKEEINGKYLDSKKSDVLSKALGAHKFIAPDMVQSFVTGRLQWEGDDVLFKTEDGNLVSVKDGVAGVAKARPELLQPSGAGGAGVRGTNAGSNGETLTMARADFEQLAPAKQMEMAQNGVVLN